jgi:hypothetical protein
MNEGAARLAGKKMNGPALVRAMAAFGVTISTMTAGNWQRGKKLPADVARGILARPPFDIPADAWDRDAGPGLATAAVPAPPPSEPTGPRPPPSSLDMPTASALAKEALAAVQVLQLQLDSSTLSIEGRKKLGDMLGAAIDRYAKYSGQGAPEKDLVNSPQWARLSDMLVGALLKHPEAARAVQAVLRAA